MTNHTPEPWKTYNNEFSIYNGQRHVAHCEDVEDAARIVACVNACSGITTEQLEKIADLAGEPWDPRLSFDVKARIIAALAPFRKD